MGWEQDINILGQAGMCPYILGAVWIKLGSHWKITVMKSFNKLVTRHTCYVAEWDFGGFGVKYAPSRPCVLTEVPRIADG